MTRRGRGVRRGASLVELLVAVALFGLVATLGAAIVRAQRRALGALSGATHARAVLRHAAAALELDLRAVGTGELPSMLGDTAVELLVPVAEGVVCATSPDGRELRLEPPRPEGADGATRWRSRPEPGDLLRALERADSAGGRWVGAELLAVGESASAGCTLPFAPGAGAVAASPVLVPALPLAPPAGPGTVVRVLRRVRWVLYRGGDGSWQLGQRRCAAPAGAGCGGVQPVAGPLAARSTAPGRTGLLAALVDAAGAPAPPAAARALRVVLRAPRPPRLPIALPGAGPAASGRDSVVLWIAARNHP